MTTDQPGVLDRAGQTWGVEGTLFLITHTNPNVPFEGAIAFHAVHTALLLFDPHSSDRAGVIVSLFESWDNLWDNEDTDGPVWERVA